MPNPKRSSVTKPTHARTNFDDRISAAAAARQSLLEQYKARPAPGDPAWIEQQAALKAIADARAARNAERKAAKEEAEARRIAAELTEQRAREQKAAAEARARALALESERKAARDARYAARKARK